MADGYSTAMSLLGKPLVVVWALMAIGRILVLLILLRRYRSPLFYVGLIFAIGVFFCFKHSYVRQDVHILYFFPFFLSLIGVLG